MSAVNKLLLVLGALVVLVAGFVVAAQSGGGDGEERAAPTPAADREAAPVEGSSDGHARGEEAAREDAAAGTGGAAAPDGAEGGDGPTATAESAPPPPDTARIRVRGGAPAGGVQEVAVRSGDRVRLTITSDTPDEVHLHGYDIERPVGPGQPARLRFTADAEGVFELELHGTGTQIATLEVRPR